MAAGHHPQPNARHSNHPRAPAAPWPVNSQVSPAGWLVSSPWRRGDALTSPCNWAVQPPRCEWGRPPQPSCSCWSWPLPQIAQPLSRWRAAMPPWMACRSPTSPRGAGPGLARRPPTQSLMLTAARRRPPMAGPGYQRRRAIAVPASRRLRLQVAGLVGAVARCTRSAAVDQGPHSPRSGRHGLQQRHDHDGGALLLGLKVLGDALGGLW